MSQPASKNIPVYSTREVSQLYTQNRAFQDLPQNGDLNQFTLTKIEDVSHILKYSTAPFKIAFHSYIFLNTGQITVQVDNLDHELFPGDFLLIPAGKIAALHKISDDATGYMGTTSEQLLDQDTISKHLDLKHLKGFLHLKLPHDLNLHFNIIFARLLTLYHQYGTNNLDIITAYFSIIFSELGLIHSAHNALPLSAPQTLVLAFKKLLGEHVYSKLKPSDYAIKLAVSTNHLNKVLKKETGQTTSTLIKKRKQIEAEILLKNSTLSVSNIAYSLGFESPAYFSRCFQKAKNMSPNAYRNQPY